MDPFHSRRRAIARKPEYRLVGSEPVGQRHEASERMLESRLVGQRLLIIVDKRVREHPGHDLCQLRQGGNGVVPVAWTPQARLRPPRGDQVAVMRKNHAPEITFGVTIRAP